MDLVGLPKQLLGKTTVLMVNGWRRDQVTAVAPDGSGTPGELHVDPDGIVRFVPTGTPTTK